MTSLPDDIVTSLVAQCERDVQETLGGPLSEREVKLVQFSFAQGFNDGARLEHERFAPITAELAKLAAPPPQRSWRTFLGLDR